MKKKNSKKVLIIVICIMVGLIILGTGGFFIAKNIISSQPIKTDWAEKYYESLENYEEVHKYDNPSSEAPKASGTFDVHFYDVEGYKPIMVTNYEYNGNNYFDLYHIKDNNEVSYYKLYGDESKVELLYDVEGKEYNYFITQKVGKSINIYKLSDYIDSTDKEEVTEYYKTISDPSVASATDKDGNELPVYHDFDTEFIRVEVDDEGFIFNINDKKSTLKNNIIKLVEKYKKLDELITKEITKEVEEKAEKINKEKSVNKAEEKSNTSNSDTFTLNGKTLHYGTYNADPVIFFESITLNSDGSAVADGKSCTWTKGTHDFAQDESTRGSIKESINMVCDDGSYPLTSCDNDTLCDGDIMYLKYVN